MSQCFYDLVPADPFARDDQDRVVSGNRAQYFTGRMRIDIRSNPHCISRAGLDNGQIIVLGTHDELRKTYKIYQEVF